MQGKDVQYGRWLSGQAASTSEPREAMDFDVCIVGAGPAGLSAAIKLKQVCPCHACNAILTLWAFVFSVIIPGTLVITGLVCSQRCQEDGKEISVCVVEKGAEVGKPHLSVLSKSGSCSTYNARC
jgi:hypothetical protein